MRSLVALLLLLLGTTVSFAGGDDNNEVVDCPSPAGSMVEGLRRMAGSYNDSNPHYVPPGGKIPREGWYATLPEPQIAKFAPTLPHVLDLYDTPFLIGTLFGGPLYGDRLDTAMACGHSMDTNQWRVLIEAVGVGYQSFDLRPLLQDETLPQAAGSYVLRQPMVSRFTIGKVQYQLVPLGIDVGLVKVWRPDLVDTKRGLGDGLPAKQPDTGDPDAVWPVLGGFSALLFADAAPWTVRQRDSLTGDASQAGFEFDERKRFSNVFDTPLYVGSVRTGGDQKQGLTIGLDSEGLVVTRSGGGTTRVPLGRWAAAQDESSYGGITQPDIDFELDGTRYKLVVETFFTMGDLGTEGPKTFEKAFVSGQLFSSLPAGMSRPPRRPPPEPQVML